MAPRSQRTWRRRVTALCLLLPASLAQGAGPYEFVEVPFEDVVLGFSSGQVEFLASTGRVEALVIFAQFADEASLGDRAPAFARRLFDPEHPGSLARYYDVMSFGQLQLRGQALPRVYASPGRRDHYLSRQDGEPGRFGLFVQEILRLVDADVDLRRFDNDGPDGVPDSGDDDGRVDYVSVLMRSTPHSFLVGGATGIAGLGFDEDFLSDDSGFSGAPIAVSGGIGHGNILGAGGRFAATVSSMAHEFGHSLGLPDLYDTKVEDGPEDDSAGIGYWGLMGRFDHPQGPVPMCAWSREQLGWLGAANEHLVEVAEPREGLVVGDVHDGGKVYRIPLRSKVVRGTFYPAEYLLLEYRTRASPYAGRQPEGLLIWHADQQDQLHHRGIQVNNKDERRKVLDLVCADGLYRDAGHPRGLEADAREGRDNLDFWATYDPAYRQRHEGNLGDATDPFDGVDYRSFSQTSNPSSRLAGVDHPAVTPVAIDDIRRVDDGMRVDVRPPAWAGTIDDYVYWSGEVLVDGDVTVAPGAMLRIYPGTRVRFAATDRLRGGRDPEACELRVLGDLEILRAPRERWDRGRLSDYLDEPVRFESIAPGGSWHGVYVVDGGRLDLRRDFYSVHGARYGVTDAAGPAPDVDPGVATVVADADVAAATGRLSAPAFSFGPNFPNPFARMTRLPFRLPQPGHVRLQIFDAVGQHLSTLVDEHRFDGEHEESWDAANGAGQRVAAGLYVAVLEVADVGRKRQKMMHLPSGFSSLSTVDSTLRARDGDWRPVHRDLAPPAGRAFGLTAAPTAAQAAYELGTLWVQMSLLAEAGTDDADRLGRRWVARMRGFDPPAVPARAVERFDAALREEPQAARDLQVLRSAAQEAVQATADDGALVHLFLGQWLQTLRAGCLAARHHGLPLAELIDAAADAETSRLFAAQLRHVGAPKALAATLNELAAVLERPPTARQARAVLAQVERVDELLGP